MKIAVMATESIFSQLINNREHINWIRIEDPASCLSTDHAALFNLYPDSAALDYSSFSIPVIINSVSETLQEKNHGPNVCRINGWSGFLNRNIWEVAGAVNENTANIFNTIGVQIVAVPDVPGLVAARVIAMIINEAYYAKMEMVSSEDEIDTAMKLGTNYPKGPFEWKREIGLREIHQLLEKMSLQDKRCQPCPLLSNEACS